MMPLHLRLSLRDLLLSLNVLRVFSFPGCGTQSGQLTEPEMLAFSSAF